MTNYFDVLAQVKNIMTCIFMPYGVVLIIVDSFRNLIHSWYTPEKKYFVQSLAPLKKWPLTSNEETLQQIVSNPAITVPI